jgi:hypothetical protein
LYGPAPDPWLKQLARQVVELNTSQVVAMAYTVETCYGIKNETIIDGDIEPYSRVVQSIGFGG